MEAIMNAAILKICGKKHDYQSKAAVENVIRYVLNENKRNTDNIWGSVGTCFKHQDGIIEDFYKLKRLYDKKDGLQVKHLVLSWGKRPSLPRKKMRKLIKQTVGFFGKNYQTVYAIHENKQPDGYHMHIVLNSVSNHGFKIKLTGKELNKFKKKFNDIWNPHGYYLMTEQQNDNLMKGKSFECS